MLNLYYHKLTRKVKQHQRAKYVMINDYVLNKVLDKIKGILGIKKLMILRF